MPNDEILFRESLWIKHFRTMSPNGYNLCEYSMDVTGIKRTEETKKIISELRKSSKNPMFGKSGILSPTWGRKHSEETKEKIRINREKNKNIYSSKKPVKQLDLAGNFIKNYESCGAAARNVFGNHRRNGNISNCCKGRTKSCQGFKWEFITQEEYSASLLL